MSKDASPIVVIDTSVLINFLAVDRMDLIERCEHRFLVTDHVREEIKDYYEERFAQFQFALERNIIDQIRVDGPQEVAMFARLSSDGRLGLGECSAIAVAINCGYNLAIDDRQAIRQARSSCGNLQILTTQDLMVSLIRAGVLDLVEADEIKDEWSANHCFRLKIVSFRELL